MDSGNGGDMNWIIPNKILAFSSPDDRMQAKNGNTSWKLVAILRQLKLKNILRQNEDFYDAGIFEQNNIKHFDLPYPDGSCPEKPIVDEMRKIYRQISGKV